MCCIATPFRLHEFDEQVAAVREGMAKVIPVPLLSLFSGYELETMVCGSPDIPLSLLKSVATYKGKFMCLYICSGFFSYNKTNLEALISQIYFWNKTTCFGQFLCPSSGVFHCIHNNGICHTGLLTACEQDQDGVPS